MKALKPAGRAFMTILFLSAAFAPVAPAAESLQSLLPEPGSIADLGPAEDPGLYDRGSLYEYIDGGAELYLSYGFERLVSASYVLGNKEEQSIVLDIYDMGSRLNAFGVFGANRREEADRVPLGVEGYASDYLLTFYRGRYYVELNAGGLDKDLLAARLAAAREVDRKIGGPAEPPSELGLLPSEGLIPGTRRYITGGILGHGFLPRGLEADYHLGDSRAKLSLALFDSPADAAKGYEALKEHYRGRGEKPEELERSGRTVLTVKDPYRDTIIAAVRGNCLAIVSDLPQASAGFGLLDAAPARID